MLKTILCVDDEVNVLRAFERQFRKQFEIHTAQGPEPGLQAMKEQGPFAVVVSDLRMPGMDGIQFLSRVREISPDTVRIMLTGHADLSDAMAAVNEGNIFQFLTKPCPSEMLTRALEGALRQHDLITSERVLLEQTLLGSIGVMTEILSMVNPAAFSRGQRIRRYVRHLAQKLNLPDRLQCEFAAMLSQVGCVAVPAGILRKVVEGQPLEASEADLYNAHCRIGHDLLARIPRLEMAAEMISHQNQGWTPSVARDPVRMGGHLLRVALDFDESVMRGTSPLDTIEWMRKRAVYSSDFLNALQEVQVEEARGEARLLTFAQLRAGMIANSDVRTKTKLLLLAKGREITESALTCFAGFAATAGIEEPINVTIPPGIMASAADTYGARPPASGAIHPKPDHPSTG